jgi:hypothetical protein
MRRAASVISKMHLRSFLQCFNEHLLCSKCFPQSLCVGNLERYSGDKGFTITNGLMLLLQEWVCLKKTSLAPSLSFLVYFLGMWCPLSQQEGSYDVWLFDLEFPNPQNHEPNIRLLLINYPVYDILF